MLNSVLKKSHPHIIAAALAVLVSSGAHAAVKQEKEMMAALNALSAGTKVVSIRESNGGITIDFSNSPAKDLTREKVESIYKDVRSVVKQFGNGNDVNILVNRKLLVSYLPDIKREPAKKADALAQHSITLSPGHGLVWVGKRWDTQRPVYGAPLLEEDYHNIQIARYLQTYLATDGMDVKNVRCMDRTGYDPDSGVQWWKMASCYWLKKQGYPKEVYDCFDHGLVSGEKDNDDDIRCRPLASNYDKTDIYVSLHTNGARGDVATGGPSGTQTYYDAGEEHAAWGEQSHVLAQNISDGVLGTLKEQYDPTWTSNGEAVRNSNGAYGEIRIPSRPAVLLELAFHDTLDRDAKYLRDDFFRSAGMWGVYKGICDYFGVKPTWDFYSCEYQGDTIPTTMAAGKTYDVSVKMMNRGVLWTEDKQIRLGAVHTPDYFTTESRQKLFTSVAPGLAFTFTFKMTAPEKPGTYTTAWQMVRDDVTWFGPIVKKTIRVVK